MRPDSLRKRSASGMHRVALVLALCAALAACGGGSGESALMEGGRDTKSSTAKATGSLYPLSVYLPPASAGPRDRLPVLYVLDGESGFDTLVGMADSKRLRIIIIANNTAGLRSRDFVPLNDCTPGFPFAGTSLAQLKATFCRT